MIDFVNTLDTVNDVVLADKLIDRTISGAYNDDKIAKIGSNAFRGCKNLTSVCFPVATSIGAGAFRDSGLKAITPETFPFVTITPSDGFRESALETVDWPSLITLSGDYVFSDCKSLRSINFPNCTKQEGRFTFDGCASLKDVNLPVVTSCPSFQRCTSLETLTLPCVTGVEYQTFSGCTKLRVIDLPACVTTGSYYTYSNCNALEALILRSTTMCVLSTPHTAPYNTFGGTPILNGEGYIYVPKALVASYKAATNWSALADKFRAIEDYPDICGG
jgi:hypothetical protein